MRYPLRAKLILFTLIPILSAYALLFALGLNQMRTQASEDAQRWLQENTANHAYRMQLALNTVALAARQLATHIHADDPQPLQAAKLLDALATAPMVFQTGVQWQGGEGLHMLRGERQVSLLPATQRSPQPQLAGWRPPPDGSAGVRYQFPIRGQGALLGNVFMQVSPAQLHQLLAQRDDGLSALHLIDGQGRFLQHQNPGRIQQDVFREAHAQQALLAELNAQQGSGLSVRDGYRLGLSAVHATPWHLIAFAPEDQLLAAMQSRANQLGLLLLASLVIIISAVVLISSHTLRPLEDLGQAADEISQGNYRIHLPPTRDDEIGRVSSAMQRLARHLQREQGESRSKLEMLESRMRTRNQELSRMIDRDRAQQVQLREARDQAEAANHAKSEFLSNMSHELRTPLNGVLGYAQLMQRDSDIGERQHDNLNAIESCGRHLLTLINDVLDLSRIEAGKLVVDQAPVNLPALLHEVRDMMAQPAAQKGLTLELKTDPELPEGMLSNATRLRQILLNLLGNAIKFTEHGSVTLAVEQQQEQLSFSVRDSGIGIAPEQQQQIFETFGQTEQGRAQGGAGLGLAISQRLIELLGGSRLVVQSEPGTGSQFSFRLPLNPCDTPQEEAIKHLPTKGQGQHLLVVDDNHDNRAVLEQLLTQSGYQVSLAADAEQAMALMHKQHFKLALLDLQLPGMSGLDLAQLIRSTAALKSCKLIAISASVSPQTQARTRDAGFDDFAGKPFEANALLGQIQALLGSAKPIIPVTAVSAEPEPRAELPPPEIAQALHTLIEDSLAIGDINSLSDLDRYFEHAQALDPELRTALARHARRFDFDALHSLSRELAEQALNS